MSDELKVGSKVAVTQWRSTPKPATITRETKTLWIVGDYYPGGEMQIRKKDLREHGGGGTFYGRKRIALWTDEHQAAVDREELRRELDRAKGHVDSATISAVRKMREVIREFMDSSTSGTLPQS